MYDLLQYIEKYYTVLKGKSAVLGRTDNTKVRNETRIVYSWGEPPAINWFVSTASNLDVHDMVKTPSKSSIECIPNKTANVGLNQFI